MIAYIPTHPHFGTFKRIENFHPLSPTLCLKHSHSPAFYLMKTKLPRQIVSQKEKKKLAIDLSKCDQISYVWVMKFKSIFHHMVIVDISDS